MINLWHSLSYDNGFNIWHTSTILSVATNPLKIKNENLFKKKKYLLTSFSFLHSIVALSYSFRFNVIVCYLMKKVSCTLETFARAL